MKQVDVLIVGAGYAGSVLAERFASQRGLRVLVIDRRTHIGGNAYDYVDADGVLVHQYGPHIFHTNSEKVSEYLSRFTAWRPYEHRVLAEVDGQRVPIPINRDTVNQLHGLDLQTEAEVEAYLAEQSEKFDRITNSEQIVVSKVGRDLYERFFRGYTRKQWDLDPSELDASVCGRIPVRHNQDDRYFTDSFQQMPVEGYTKMFERILDHPGIEVELGVSFDEVRDRVSYGHLVYTGPIDEYFEYRFGPLQYRSLEFRLESHDTPDGELLQSTGTINFPSEDVPYTRVTEFRHLTGQDSMQKTVLAYEYPRAEGDPYYPVPRPENRELYKRYQELAEDTPGVTFAGRLGSYQYLNMDQAVGQALATFERSEVGLVAEASDAR